MNRNHHLMSLSLIGLFTLLILVSSYKNILLDNKTPQPLDHQPDSQDTGQQDTITVSSEQKDRCIDNSYYGELWDYYCIPSDPNQGSSGNYNYDNYEAVQVPEFSTIAALAALFGSLAVFIIVRKRN